MEYQKMMNLLDDTTNQPSRFRTRDWVEINDESKERYNSTITFKAFVAKSNLCDCSDAYILVKGTITAGAAVHTMNEKVIFENSALFTDCITEIDNTQIDDGQKTDVVMPIYNVIDYSGAYSKTSRSLWQYYRDEPALDNKGNIVDFPADKNNSASFKFKQKVTGQAGNGGRKDTEVMVLLKYPSNFGGTLEMPL